MIVNSGHVDWVTFVFRDQRKDSDAGVRFTGLSHLLASVSDTSNSCSFMHKCNIGELLSVSVLARIGITIHGVT